MNYVLRFFDNLGLTVNVAKSVLYPSQNIEYLGFLLDSVDMSVVLAHRKQVKIFELGSRLLFEDNVTIRFLSSFIGNVVASAPGVHLAPLRYKPLELVRNRALVNSRGNYDGFVRLSLRARLTVSWWVDNIHSMRKPMFPPPPSRSSFAMRLTLAGGLSWVT